MKRTRLSLIVLAAACAALIGSVLTLHAIMLRAAGKNLMVLHPNGLQRPDDFGIASQQVWLQSGDRRLQASIVAAHPGCSDKVAVLLFHGRGETISDWAEAQAFLSRQCVASMALVYSGHGSSTPPARIATLNAGAVAAYADFVRRFPGAVRRCILGHLMGVAPMLNAYPTLAPTPDCVVAASGFSSLEDTALAGGAPALLAALLRGTWNNVEAIGAVHGNLLVIHSDSDTVVAPDMAQRLEAAAPATAVRVHGARCTGLTTMQFMHHQTPPGGGRLSCFCTELVTTNKPAQDWGF